MPVIKLENLAKQYGSTRVIHDINLSMDENEFTVMVGPSGCGKSTTLRMIAGLESVTGGKIFMDDKEISQLEPKERDLAMVFQDYALYPHMNVARNMSFGLRLAKYPKNEISKRVNEIANTLGLTQFLTRKPSQLSGGQRQRVAMGRALVRDTSTLLMDEPLSNLDAKLRGQMRVELAMIRQKFSKNIIYVTHDQVEAMTLGDRIIVMQGGYIQQQGTPEELYKKPRNKFVAGFIGSPPMNFFNAELTTEQGKLTAVGNGFSLRLSGHQNRFDTLPDKGGITIGIRPSAFKPAADNSNHNIIELPVIVSEYVGSYVVLISEFDGNRVAIELDTNVPLHVGGLMKFTVDSNDVYLFNQNTNDAIY